MGQCTCCQRGFGGGHPEDLSAVELRDDGGIELGEVVAIDNFGAGDILEIAKPDGKRFMVPMNVRAVPSWSDDGVTIDAAFVE